LANNGTGAIVTFVVLGITAYTKFLSGAWLVVVLVPTMVITFFKIRAHYGRAQAALKPRPVAAPTAIRHTVIVSAFHGGNEVITRALAYTGILTAEHVVAVGRSRLLNAARSEHVDSALEYVAIDDGHEYRALVKAIKEARQKAPDHRITIMLPVLPRGPIQMLTQSLVRRTLLRRQNVAVLQMARQLDPATVRTHHTNLVSVASLTQASIEAMAYCRSLLTGRLLALHVVAEEDLARMRQEWDAWGNHVPLVTIDSPYRSIVAPLRAYVEALAEREGGEMITMALPLVVAKGKLGRFLHNHTANYLRRLLLKEPNMVVISVPHEIP
jgi:hypothetical protein